MDPANRLENRGALCEGSNETTAEEAYLKRTHKISEHHDEAADGLAVHFKHDLHRGLKSRQIAMVQPLPTKDTDVS